MRFFKNCAQTDIVKGHIQMMSIGEALDFLFPSLQADRLRPNPLEI